MEQTQKQMLVKAIASSMIEAMKNSYSFASKVNEVVNDAFNDAFNDVINDLKNSIDVSVEEEVIEVITKVVDSITWTNKDEVNEALEGLVEKSSEPHPLKLNREGVRQIDAHVFYQGVPKTTEELVAFMRFACECEDVGFLEVAKRINHMQWILSIL